MDWRENYLARWGTQMDLAIERVAMFRDGRMKYSSMDSRGIHTDVTHEAIEADLSFIARLEPGVTKARAELAGA